MSSQNARVLVIETGTDEFNGSIQDQFGTIEGWSHYPGEHWSGHWVRMLGGTSSVWGGWCAALSDRDFKTWTITRADLDTYYSSAAQTLGVPESAMRFRSDVLNSFHYKPISDEDPLRFSDPTRFPTFREDPNVHVLLGHSVGPLTANEVRTRVQSFVLYGIESRTQEVVFLNERQTLVLAGGGMGNAQILLGSALESDTPLGNETGQVGRYLQEHPHLFAGKVLCR